MDGRPILVTGFGPFLEIAENPSEALARALDGRRVAGRTIIGRGIPVSYERGPAETIALARAVGAGIVLGVGVARSRSAAEIESIARDRVAPDALDVDGARPAGLGGPSEVTASLSPAAAAAAFGIGISSDAGAYVCNAWLYRVTLALPGASVGFLHVPLSGLSPERALEGLSRLAGGR